MTSDDGSGTPGGVPHPAASPTRRELARWEMVCVPLEMAGVAFGLWLGLGRGAWDAAGFVTLAVCVLSFAARSLHYGRPRAV